MVKLFCIFIGLLLSLPVIPVSAQELERGTSGALGCIGGHSFRLGGAEISFTAYNFRNFNPNTTVTITGITVYAGDGSVSLSMPPFPADFDSVLGPNQSSSFTTIDLFGTSPPSGALAQVIVNWTASARGVDLYGNVARQDRGRDTTTGALLEQRTRGVHRCVTLR